MTKVTKHAQSIEVYADCVQHRSIRSLFESKETRDRVAAELKRRGKKIKKGSTRGQILHPEYVTDFVGEYETGVGNTDYNTYWKVLYFLSVVE